MYIILGLKIFFCSLLLLLSGDVELNPGPVIDERPDISVLLDLLEPLENWQLFGRQLPGITQQIIDMIQQSERSPRQQKEALIKKWFEENPKATWKDVVAALKRRKETKLIEDIEDHLASTCDLLELKSNHGQVAPKEVLRFYSEKLTAAITNNLHTISSALYANGIMPLNIKSRISSTTGSSDYEKASYLVTTMLRQMEASLNPQKDLINICHILINQKHQTLSDIAISILDQLGQPYKVNSLDPLDDVQKYIAILKEKYLSQSIIASDWPPRVGRDFFGRLTLVRENNFTSQAEYEKYSWCMLRGHIDEISYIRSYKEVAIKTMLNPDILSLRVAIDGPPGIGKTTLCRKLLNMWSKGSHELQHYDLVLYCPFRHKAIAEATKLVDLFVYESPKVSKVVDWILEREGKGLLIIFDGWDELSTQLRESSLATKIICRNQLVRSSVIVTSRTYATASIYQLECLNLNVHVIGFAADEINYVIKGMLSQKLAEKLIEDLQFRSDVLSLCYVPLVCSM
uniref:NACHT domain-containing protein n=1 Tax=Amphimedon queenslandica TaxID=400682 RepID=A0A1X7T3B5_AMPQE